MKFTKKDLKTGMICEHRDGNLSVVFTENCLNENILIFHPNDVMPLKDFHKNDFRWILNCTKEQIAKDDRIPALKD